MIEEMKKIIRHHDLCVLATTDRERPHTSLMSYIADEECRHLFLVTSPNTRKFSNLIANPEVSLLIDTREAVPPPDRGRVMSLIVSGTAGPIDDQGVKDVMFSRFRSLRPHLKDLLDDPLTELIDVHVHSIQLLDGVSTAHLYEFA